MIAVGIDANVKQLARGPRGVDRPPNGDPFHCWIEIYSGADYRSMCKIAKSLRMSFQPHQRRRVPVHRLVIFTNPDMCPCM